MQYLIGQLVRNKKFGVGKILAVSGDTVTVFFKDQADNPKTINVALVPMEILKDQSDSSLDKLDVESVLAGRFERYLPHQQAVQRFLAVFPGGFSDRQYVREERRYKVEAHKLWCEELNKNVFSKLLSEQKYAEVVRRALQVEGGTNLLAVYEKAALREAVKEPHDAQAFALGLYDLIYGSTEFEQRFNTFRNALDKLPQPKTPLRWTVQTIFPFLALPEQHIFLKPEVTQEAAERRAFTLNYQAQPNWLTYACLLDFAKTLIADLKAMKPRDMIDIQSFIWVTGSE